MSIIPVSLPSTPKDGNQHFTIFTAPAVEPVTVSEVKTFGRIDGTDEDALITGFIQSVREEAEKFLGRALIDQVVRMTLDYWPGNIVELQRPPLSSVSGIYLIDEDGVSTTYAASNYFVVTDSIPGQIVIRDGITPPVNEVRDVAGIRIDYVAGYGSTAVYVPRAIKDALMQWTMQVYEQRCLTPEPPPEARVLLSSFRCVWY
jgi:uncharacterized phiE125 gp8 family phage protein